jgi:hypothetical protein
MRGRTCRAKECRRAARETGQTRLSLPCRSAQFDTEFTREFVASVTEHGDFIVKNLEWHPTHRANHYLADLVGPLFVGAYLPRSMQADAWLAFAVQQLVIEVHRQFPCRKAFMS